MHNIKKIGVRILLIIVVLLLYESVVEFLYRPYNDVILYTSKDRKELSGDIETLLCGTSTTQRGMDPEIIDNVLETVSFNTASNGQPLKGTYELIKDADKYNPVKTVILGISPDGMMKEEEEIGQKLRTAIYSRMEGNFSKLSYLVRECPLGEWPYILLYSSKVDDYFDCESIRENVDVKLSEEYKADQIIESDYKTKGMLAVGRKTKAKQLDSIAVTESVFAPEKIQEKELRDLIRIIEYCKEEQIELILVYPPLTGNKIKFYGDMSTTHEYYTDIATKYDVQFWDFNYYTKLKTVFTNDKFYDKKHLNGEGAKAFSEELAYVYNQYHAGENIEENFLDVCPYYLENN